MKYIYHKVDGTTEEIVRETKLSLEEMQGLVDGYIEFAQLPNGHTLCLNEEGLMNDMPENPAFSYADLGWGPEMPGKLRGNIIEGQDVETEDDTEFQGF